ncbi:helix-turn-helix domain-containing protein [Notoacmeibacter ruber]|uniref:Helix-turn-helix domain-containing protein n=1 Tax=Notoacmeibacter ruber TaxID=2670375 RepID=A0A3L7JFL3_9HYPH|nr:helix-turn-helix domain-containing protein [Notoacmeibacter ruber]RLQ89270.1 helix-turn-helix domain-containing protein [Notoacmeibacter ruber]
MPKKLIGPNSHVLEKNATSYAKFLSLHDEGCTVKEAARRLGVSASTIYRWQRGLEWDWFEGDGFGIENAIEALCYPERFEKDVFLIAVLEFMVWIQSPHLAVFANQNIAACLIAYHLEEGDCLTLADVPNESRKVIEEGINLYTVLRIVDASVDIQHPLYSEIDFNLDERSALFLAEICEFFISSAAHSKYGGKASKIATHDLISKGVFGASNVISKRTYDKLLVRRGASLPFLYASFYHSDIDWILNPAEENFVKRVNAIVTDPARVKHYFSVCKWVSGRLRDVLHKGTKLLEHLPQFPEDLSATRVEVTELSDLQISALNDWYLR